MDYTKLNSLFEKIYFEFEAGQAYELMSDIVETSFKNDETAFEILSDWFDELTTRVNS